jgi:hypothetical protein
VVRLSQWWSNHGYEDDRSWWGEWGVMDVATLAVGCGEWVVSSSVFMFSWCF